MVIAMGGSVTVFYDPDDEREYSIEVVARLDEPVVTTTAILNRPWHALKLRCISPENVMGEAFAEGNGINCVVRQTCAKYNSSREEVEAEIDDTSETIAPGREE